MFKLKFNIKECKHVKERSSSRYLKQKRETQLTLKVSEVLYIQEN